MQRGVFIAFEGGEGSGKDTMIDRLKNKYADQEKIVFTREPGGTKVGERIRSILMDPESKGMSVRTEIMLFVAARVQLVSEVVAPALAQGKIVISNRFGLSTLAYQIYGRQREKYLPFLLELSHTLVGEYVPHYILLDVTPEVGLRRVEARNDGKTRFDAENLAFHSRVRHGYLSSLSAHGSKNQVIDAEKPLEDVWADVELAVEQLIR